MRWRLKTGIALFGFALLASRFDLLDMGRPLSGQTPPVQDIHLGDGGVPTFRPDPSWPRVPTNWRLGGVSSACADAENNIWIIQRPRTLPNDLRAKAAPPVIEFDNTGNFIRAWGGEGEGYEWPQNEHSIYVDYKGFVWILGSDKSDGQILKFTKSGKFVKQFGRSGQTGDSNSPYLNRPTGIWLYPRTNELFVSDGYGNRRVVVLDADSGRVKRYWGAYGNKPVDIGPPRFDKDIFEGDINNPSVRPPDPWRAYAENLQQFSTVHDVKVSNDGLVYVADRGNKRIQVFTVDGKYVAQQFVGVDNTEYLQSRSVAFSSDPRQTFLYVAGNPQIYILNRRTLEILGSFRVGQGEQHPLNHLIATDGKGNIYTSAASPEGHVEKLLFSGFSPSFKRTANVRNR
jgi:DNA-binding beta-propeller fold protein YncE